MPPVPPPHSPPRRPHPLRRLARRLRGPQRNARRAYARWRAEVEPGLRDALRVQRFGEPTLTVERGGPVAEMTVVRDPRELGACRAPWVLVADPDARLDPGAAEAFGRVAALVPDAAVITCDEDRVGADGERIDPVIRPGPSPDLLAERDLAGAAVLVARERAMACGVPPDHPRWRLEATRALTGADGAGAAHVAAILAHATGPRSREAPASPRRTPLAGEPSVEVVIPFRDRPALLERAAGSLLRETAYERLQVTLVDNGSVEAPPDTLARDPRVTVLPDPRPFNFAALCNAAASRSRADVLVFLNNDTEIVEPGWLERLIAEARRPEVGAVAPLLTYPGGRVQHAGVALGLYGYAGHPFAGLRPDEPTAFGPAAAGTRNWLAVTAACMAVERSKLAAAGGFDERFAVTGQDVDLCLRLTARGHRSLCLTDVRVVHDEAASRGDDVLPEDLARSAEAYGAFRAAGDPFYSPALTRASTNCALRMPGEPW